MTSSQLLHASQSDGDASTAPCRPRRSGVLLPSWETPAWALCPKPYRRLRETRRPAPATGPWEEGSLTRSTCRPGRTCTLEGTTVDGNVSVGPCGTLVARGVAVDGDGEGEGARLVEVSDSSTIGGSLQLQQGGSSTVSDSHIRGELLWSEQDGAVAVQRTRRRSPFMLDRDVQATPSPTIRVMTGATTVGTSDPKVRTRTGVRPPLES